MPVYEVVDEQTMYGQIYQNVLHFFRDDVLANAPSLLADDFQNAWVNNIRGLQMGTITHTRIKVRELGSANATFEKVINVPGTNGGAVTDIIPFVSEILQLRTALSGRHGRGRVYIAGIKNGTFVSGFITGTRLTEWTPKITGIMAAYGPTGSSQFRLCVIPRAQFTQVKQVTAMQVASRPGVQRRRNVGVGI